MEHDISTVEYLRVAWPVVISVIGLIIFQASEATMNKQARQELKDFKSKEYPADKDGFLRAIRDVRDAQEKSEARIEAKLEKISDQSTTQIEKVLMKVNETNILLAELKGRLSNTQQASDLKL